MSESLGDVSNNFAEYVGALRALEHVERSGRPSVDIEMDSRLVCCQFRGEWQVAADALKLLFRTAFAIICRLRRSGAIVQLRHIYREFNTDADRRAKNGADGIAAHHTW